MSLTALNTAITSIRALLHSLEDANVNADQAKIEMGFVMARLPKEVTRKSVHDGLKGARGYDKVKADMSKATTCATVFGIGLGKDAQDMVEVVRGADGKPLSKGWRRLYDAYTDKVKPGEWTAQVAWEQVQSGWLHPRYSKEKEAASASTRRHIVVTVETGERFDGYLKETDLDSDTAVVSLLDAQDDTVPMAIARAVKEFFGAGGVEAVLEARIRAATAKVKGAV